MLVDDFACVCQTALAGVNHAVSVRLHHRYPCIVCNATDVKIVDERCGTEALLIDVSD